MRILDALSPKEGVESRRSDLRRSARNRTANPEAVIWTLSVDLSSNAITHNHVLPDAAWTTRCLDDGQELWVMDSRLNYSTWD